MLNSGQLIATSFIVRKCQHTINLIDKWYESSCQYHLLDDSHSHTPNDPSFTSARHDQSIFSVLRKKFGTEMTNFDETWFAPNWAASGENYPIWASRTRN